jgi:hypothetical protein
MSSSPTPMTAFWQPHDPLVWPRMSLEGRASRFHWGPANDRIRRSAGLGHFRGPARNHRERARRNVMVIDLVVVSTTAPYQ